MKMMTKVVKINVKNLNIYLIWEKLDGGKKIKTFR